MLGNGDLELSFATLEIEIRKLLNGCDRPFRLSAARANRRPVQPRPFATVRTSHPAYQLNRIESTFSSPLGCVQDTARAILAIYV